jgi:hypothetical protein
MSKKNHSCKILCNELSIEVSKSNKTLNITNKNWGSPINNSLNLARIHVNVISKDDVGKEFHFGLMKFTFLQSSIKVWLPWACPKQVEHVIHTLLGFWRKWGCHQCNRSQNHLGIHEKHYSWSVERRQVHL